MQGSNYCRVCGFCKVYRLFFSMWLAGMFGITLPYIEPGDKIRPI